MLTLSGIPQGGHNCHPQLVSALPKARTRRHSQVLLIVVAAHGASIEIDALVFQMLLKPVVRDTERKLLGDQMRNGGRV